MAWRQFVMPLGALPAQEVEALFFRHGAQAVTFSDGGDVPVLEPAPGETPLWPDVTVTALFDAAADQDAVRALLERALGPSAQLAIDAVADDELVSSGLGGFEPLRVGPRLWLISADDDEPSDRVAAVRLHRGLAFGTGEHPTTALCLEWIEASLAPGSVVLDYGCGSGVLALAALRLGASRAFAVDNDPQALAATRANAELNGLSGRLWIGPPESLPAFRADVLIANILADPLIALAPSFSERVVTGGHVVLSGVLDSQRSRIEQAYRPHFEIVATAERGSWLRIEARKRASFEPTAANGRG